MSQLSQLLEKLNLSEERGIILLSKVDTWYNTDFFSFEVRERLNKIQPDAVYYFNNQPFMLFFDKSDSPLKEQKEDKQIFEEVWSWDFIPVVFILYPDGDKIYNAFNYQKQIGGISALEEIKVSNKYDYFSFWNLQSGFTWKWLEENFYTKNGKSVLNKQRVSQKLFENIKYARKEIEQKFPYPSFINLLLLRLIFIRYLIDREVEIDEKFIRGNSVSETRACFNDLIGKKQKLLQFFGYLKLRFNGNLFDSENDPDIPDHVLQFLKAFFSDDFAENSNQASLFYFDVYDFSIIPIEVISGIYESVIDPKKREEESAVYTPLFLADYILDHTVDQFLQRNKKLCKVLDPSCGSGIFLTQTYRRLVEHEKHFGQLSDERLVEIAKENIFGIDRDHNALNVAAFSIYISILDYKKPKEIKTFHLPSLIGNNLFRNDFFNEDDKLENIDEEIVHPFNYKLKEEKLDFILGNPPWGRKNDKKLDRFHLSYAKKMGDLISNYEISQSFLIRAKDFSTQTTDCSLIVSSRAFYNSRAKNFKSYFFQNFLVHSILDLSAARRMVFQKANSPCIVIGYKFAFFEHVGNNNILYRSIKPNRFLKNHKTIVVEGDDVKYLQQKYFAIYPWFFKVALFGNKLDFKLLRRLEAFKENNATIDNIIDNKILTFKGKGFFKGTPDRYFTFLKGKSLIESNQIQAFYTPANISDILLEKEDTYLEAGKTVNLFSGNQILLGKRTKNESEIRISYTEGEYAFKDSIYGISSKNEKGKLLNIYGLLISHITTYFHFLTSSSWGVSTRPEITLEEYLSFPYIEDQNDKIVRFASEIIESYKTHNQLLLKGQKTLSPDNLDAFRDLNKVISNLYQLSEVEEDLIDYVFKVSRYQFQESKLHKFLIKPTQEELHEYAQVFFDYYSSVYNEQNEYFYIEIYQLGYFSAMMFHISEYPIKKDQYISLVKGTDEEALLKRLASNLSIYEMSTALFVQKNIRGYESDFFYIIKPNEYKCWHKATAHHDLAIFKSEMMQAELETMNKSYV